MRENSLFCSFSGAVHRMKILPFLEPTTERGRCGVWTPSQKLGAPPGGSYPKRTGFPSILARLGWRYKKCRGGGRSEYLASTSNISKQAILLLNVGVGLTFTVSTPLCPPPPKPPHRHSPSSSRRNPAASGPGARPAGRPASASAGAPGQGCPGGGRGDPPHPPPTTQWVREARPALRLVDVLQLDGVEVPPRRDAEGLLPQLPRVDPQPGAGGGGTRPVRKRGKNIEKKPGGGRRSILQPQLPPLYPMNTFLRVCNPFAKCS